jgi:hypothetical protein
MTNTKVAICDHSAPEVDELPEGLATAQRNGIKGMLAARRNGGKGRKQRLQLFATEHEVIARSLIQHVLALHMKRPAAASLVVRVALRMLVRRRTPR